jgi:hypothetical protein
MDPGISNASLTEPSGTRHPDALIDQIEHNSNNPLNRKRAVRDYPEHCSNEIERFAASIVARFENREKCLI